MYIGPINILDLCDGQGYKWIDRKKSINLPTNQSSRDRLIWTISVAVQKINTMLNLSIQEFDFLIKFDWLAEWLVKWQTHRFVGSAACITDKCGVTEDVQHLDDCRKCDGH